MRQEQKLCVAATALLADLQTHTHTLTYVHDECVKTKQTETD